MFHAAQSHSSLSLVAAVAAVAAIALLFVMLAAATWEDFTRPQLDQPHLALCRARPHESRRC